MNVNAAFSKNVLELSNDPRWHNVSQTVLAAKGNISKSFYSTLSQIPDLKRILGQDLIEERLDHSLQEWLVSLFQPHDEESFFKLLTQQQQIGLIHSKIDLDLSAFNFAIQLIKREIYQYLQESDLNASDLFWATTSVGQFIDIVNNFIIDSFFLHQIKYEQQESSLRIIGVIENVAVECERLRSLLFDWNRLVVPKLYEVNDNSTIEINSLQDSEFGLWILYKVDYLNQPEDTVNSIREAIKQIDEELVRAITYRKNSDSDGFFNALKDMNSQVTHLSWNLVNIAENSIKHEYSLDPLTRVLNRRYMDSILRRLTMKSIAEKKIFTILLVDLDDFKMINDRYGHDFGDKMLSGFASFLMKRLKQSDFIFRYGGEEFLLVLAATDEPDALALAKQICEDCQHQRHITDSGDQVTTTCSIGIAVHDGHPDYSNLINKADKALYQAKSSGKNQSVLFNQNTF